MGLTRHQRIAVEARVFGRVWHHKEPWLENGMGTDGDIQRGFAHTKPDLSLEPLSVILDQVHDSDGGLAHMGCDANNVIELDLTRRIEDAVLPQRSQTLSLVPLWSALLIGSGIITATHGTNLDCFAGWLGHQLTKVNEMSRVRFELSC
jgi:hypothetical protein